MGAFLTNYHVRTSDRAACIKALKSIIRSRAMVTKPANGWITVCDETSESQDMEELRRVGEAVSLKLKAAVFCFLVHDSDTFVYLLYEKGKLIDQFDSRPDYFGPISDEQRKEWSGHFDKLLHLTISKITSEQIATVLSEKQFVEEERAARFAQLFGIEEPRAREGFKYAKQENREYEVVLRRGYSSHDSELVEAVGKRDLLTVRRLLESGTSPNLTDSIGAPILAKAIQYKTLDVANALIDAGADVLAPGKIQADSLLAASTDGNLEILRRVLDKANGDTRLPKSLDIAFRAAVALGKASVVPLLVAAGANVNWQDEGGQTPLMIAAVHGFEGAWEAKTKKQFPVRPGETKTDWKGIVETLLKAGANPNFQMKDGVSALMVAASRGDLEICQLLVEAGADINLKHSKGVTALSLAITAGHTAVANLLRPPAESS